MQFGIVISAGGPRDAAELAAEAEAAGWDGAFTWDGVAIGEVETFDPWVTLAAMAMRTSRVRLGALVTPPARRRPWKLAREVLSVDHLSNGRLVLPVGLGALDDAAFGGVGEPTAARTRAELLDESLAIVEGLLTGEPFGFQGAHYRFAPMTFRPPALQRPRVPVWVVAVTSSERSLARAFRWDGIVTQGVSPEEVRGLAARARPGFDIVVDGRTDPSDPASLVRVATLGAAGATWWTEADWDRATVESLRARIAAGPPRV